jgi:hypothetical protein
MELTTEQLKAKKDLRRRRRNLKQCIYRRLIVLKVLIKEEPDLVLKQILIDEANQKRSAYNTLALYKV